MCRVLLATSEAVPLAKTGGLADVSGALPAELQSLGCDVTLIMPGYRTALEALLQFDTPVNAAPIPFEVPIGKKIVSGLLQLTTLPGTDVRTVLVIQPEYYDRDELYTEAGVDYRDNCERFLFFSRAVLEAVRILDLKTELIHCNDWQTAMVPVFLSNEYRPAPGYEQLATLLTIHNLAYQGRFWHWDMLLTGLDWRLFNWKQLEFFGDLNFLKGGIVFADRINTVSPRYAEEIQGEQFGFGLEGALRARAAELSGILNGADYATWDPAIDPHLPTSYDVSSWKVGKAACKSQLQKDLGLAVKPDVPLAAFVGRLTQQKGADILISLMRDWAASEAVQWVVLGTGEPALETALQELSGEFPKIIAGRIEFSEPLAHQILAASDLFVMPSRFEPCGLTQFYCLKYGSIPIVHAVGGLADSICESPQGGQQPNGYRFEIFSREALAAALDRAVRDFGNASEWSQLVSQGMMQDWSWKRSAMAYVELYKSAIATARNSVCV